LEGHCNYEVEEPDIGRKVEGIGFAPLRKEKAQEGGESLPSNA